MNEFESLRVDTGFSLLVKEIPKHRASKSTYETKVDPRPSRSRKSDEAKLRDESSVEDKNSDKHLSIDDNSDSDQYLSPTKDSSLLQPLPILAKKPISEVNDDCVINRHIQDYIKS